MNLSIFKTYDVRGLYGSEITDEIAYNIGLNLPKFFNTKEIAVGMDARISSPTLKKALINGINESGGVVLDIGICTTPMLSFTVAYKNLKGGIMISASHNPPEYNAFKVIGERALQISSESGLNKLKDLVEENYKKYTESLNLVGRNVNIIVLDEYINHILPKFNFTKNIKVVSDFGNGVGSVSALPIFKKINQIDCINLYAELDGTFPNHFADPHHLENMEELRKRVIEEKADLGLFFDGDADRCYFIDETGTVLLADIAFCLLAEEELKKNISSDTRVYYDLRFTKEIVKVVKNNGGNPVMMRVGNPFYKEKLINEGGLMASEFSGHIMYKENFGIDDGIFAALKLIEILSNKDLPLSKLVEKYKTFQSLPENSIKVEGKDIDLIINNLKQEFKDGNEIIMDGLYIEYPTWWFNLRRSNTEPVVRLRVEADDKKTLDLQNSKILNIINS